MTATSNLILNGSVVNFPPYLSPFSTPSSEFFEISSVPTFSGIALLRIPLIGVENYGVVTLILYQGSSTRDPPMGLVKD